MNKEIKLKKFGKTRTLKYVTRNAVTNVFIDDEWLGAVRDRGVEQK